MLPMQILFAFESEFVVKEKSPISGYCSETEHFINASLLKLGSKYVFLIIT